MAQTRIYLFNNIIDNLSRCDFVVGEDNLLTSIKTPLGNDLFNLSYNKGEIKEYNDYKGNWWDKDMCRFEYPFYHNIINLNCQTKTIERLNCVVNGRSKHLVEVLTDHKEFSPYIDDFSNPNPYKKSVQSSIIIITDDVIFLKTSFYFTKNYPLTKIVDGKRKFNLYIEKEIAR